jgi:hypothetical protein
MRRVEGIHVRLSHQEIKSINRKGRKGRSRLFEFFDEICGLLIDLLEVTAR